MFNYAKKLHHNNSYFLQMCPSVYVCTCSQAYIQRGLHKAGGQLHIRSSFQHTCIYVHGACINTCIHAMHTYKPASTKLADNFTYDHLSSIHACMYTVHAYIHTMHTYKPASTKLADNFTYDHLSSIHACMYTVHAYIHTMHTYKPASTKLVDNSSQYSHILVSIFPAYMHICARCMHTYMHTHHAGSEINLSNMHNTYIHAACMHTQHGAHAMAVNKYLLYAYMHTRCIHARMYCMHVYMHACIPWRIYNGGEQIFPICIHTHTLHAYMHAYTTWSACNGSE
jgi:hypothetical protein